MKVRFEVARAGLALAAVATLAGCGTRPPRPVAQTVCVDARQETVQEPDYLRRRVDMLLARDGFTPSKQPDCDIEVKYEQFGKFQAEVVNSGIIIRSSRGYWTQEGIIRVTQGSKVLVEDESINLRGKESKQELLDKLAERITNPVTDGFRVANRPQVSSPNASAAAAR